MLVKGGAGDRYYGKQLDKLRFCFAIPTDIILNAYLYV